MWFRARPPGTSQTLAAAALVASADHEGSLCCKGVPAEAPDAGLVALDDEPTRRNVPTRSQNGVAVHCDAHASRPVRFATVAPTGVRHVGRCGLSDRRRFGRSCAPGGGDSDVVRRAEPQPERLHFLRTVRGVLSEFDELFRRRRQRFRPRVWLSIGTGRAGRSRRFPTPSTPPCRACRVRARRAASSSATT